MKNVIISMRSFCFVAVCFFAVGLCRLQADDEWLQRADATEIPGRLINSAIWTGEEMLVWGGEGLGASYDSGARFSVKNNAWTVMSSVDAPDHRSKHGSVWTGSEMIVWGGYNGTFLQSGGRYNLKTDTWTPMSTSGAPSARSPTAMIWTGSEVIIWGGSDLGPTVYGDGAIYNPQTDTWRSMSQTGAPSARGGGGSYVWTGTEMIVWGGHNGSVAVGDGAIYNPQTDTWRPMSSISAPGARTWMLSSVWTGTEMIVWGGASNDLTSSYGDGARYNPTTDTWSPMSNDGAPSARNRMTMVWTGKEAVVFGGATGSSSSTFVNDGARYNPETDTWSVMTTVGSPSARVHHSAIWTGASMLIYGGYTGSSHSQELFSYSPYDITGLSQSWLVEFFGDYYRHDPRALPGADPDGDGSNNLKEFQSGSSPLDPLSGFASSVHMTPTIKWHSVPGVSYRILRKANINDSNWEVVAESVLATETETTYLDFTSSSNSGFYVVEALSD